MADSCLTSLSLCAGVGGIDLGIRLALSNSRVVAYVEGEAYACAVLAARMEEGALDPAPIWTDLRSFDGSPWRGVVDLVTAGFPCQPFSLAGKRQYEADERHLWPDIARIVSECEPALVFLENVAIRAFVEPWRDLRRLGFSLSRPFACTAAELGAGHLRRRVFVLAYRNGIRLEGNPREHDSGSRSRRIANARAFTASDGEHWSARIAREGWEEGMGAPRTSSPDSSEGGWGARLDEVQAREPDAQRGTSPDLEHRSGYEPRRSGGTSREGETVSRSTPGNAALVAKREPTDEADGEPREQQSRGVSSRSSWWASEPGLERLVRRAPHRLDRDRARGNICVPIVAAYAFRVLANECGLPLGRAITKAVKQAMSHDA